MRKFLVLFVLFSLTKVLVSISTNCQVGCQQCLETKSLCISCRNDYQLSNSGQCIANTISSCSKYQNRLICSKCRPSFRLLNNRCSKMNDGCMESSQLSLCSNCVDTSILDKSTSTCLINELNCEELGRNRKCIKCKQNYRLDLNKNICIFNSSLCVKTDQNTGLCTICATNYTLIGFDCFRTQKIRNLTNCYLAIETLTTGNVDCKYCKQGYLLISGACNPKSIIINVNSLRNCSETSQYVDVDNSCKPIPLQCKFFDYGFKKCAYCENGRTLMRGICKKDIHKNCLNFTSKNPDLCQICKPKYYLNQDSQCISFPPFCQEVSRSKCLKCIDSFLLTSNSLCVDPNCFQINQFSMECNQCKNNYVKDMQGICIFVDPNCEDRRNSTSCAKCKQNFKPNAVTGICEFLDPNCALFSNKNVCLQCNPKFYYNINAQRCLKLSDNCLVADDRGECKECNPGFVLTSNRECVRTNPIPNCKISSSKSSDLCSQCELQYYLTLKGTCELLPLFCMDFDAAKDKCKNCDLTRSKLEDGLCKDKNCQYLDFDGTCLGCFQGYQFGTRGECQVQQKDPNCKEFVYDQCSKCSDKFYFDKNWKCVPVSSLCRQYDQNSGLCTGCYQGYILSEEPEGQCIVGDPIFNPCKQEDKKTGDCIQCTKGHELAKTDTNKIVCTKIDSSLSNSCLQFKNKKCSRCIASRFLNKDGQCEEIDQKCMKYDQTTGECLSCYEGYELKLISKITTNQTKEVCLSKTPTDLNCKTFDKTHSDLCVECYPGYQVSSQTNKCQLFHELCQTKNQLGQCVACFLGYKLMNGTCTVSPKQSTQIQETVLSIPGCETPSSNSLACDQCQWGYLKKDGICLKKDENCRTFKDESSSLECLECYGGYGLIPNNPNVCLLESKIDKNCQQYDENYTCVQCKTGFKLFIENQQKSAICQSLVTDIMCIKYNYEQGACEQCLPNLIVTENGKCDYPLYGFDPNCFQYKNKICVKCVQNYTLNPSFICARQP